MARLTVDMREAISGFLVPVGPAVRGRRAATPQELRRIDTAFGRFAALTSDMRSRMEGGDASPALKRSYDSVMDTAVGPNSRMAERTVEQARQGPPSTDDAAWNVVIDGCGVAGLRDVAAAELLAKAEETRRSLARPDHRGRLCWGSARHRRLAVPAQGARCAHRDHRGDDHGRSRAARCHVPHLGRQDEDW